ACSIGCALRYAPGFECRGSSHAWRFCRGRLQRSSDAGGPRLSIQDKAVVRSNLMDGATSNIELHARYTPVGVYYEDADMVEYIRKDVPCVNRRIDDLLTLALDMESREPIGFKLKGFKNFYLHYFKPAQESEVR